MRSINVTNKVVVAKNVNIPNNLHTQFSKAIKALESHEYSHGGNLEKLNKYQLFSLRLNQKDRILLTFVRIRDEIQWHIVELCDNHNYAKAKFVRTPTLIRDYIKANSDYDVVDEIPQAEVLKKHLHVTELTIYDNKLITLSNQQGEAINTPLPAIIIGGPGSGKTCVALELLKKFLAMQSQEDIPHKPILYVTKSPALVRYLQAAWTSLPEASMDVKFITLEDLFKECYPDKQIVGDRSLAEFLKAQKKRTKFKCNDAKLNLIKQEMKIISVVKNFDEYMAFGDRHSLIKDNNEKRWLYSALEEYLIYLEGQEQVNPDFSSLNIDNKFYALVCDEAQDLSLKTKHELLRATERGKVCFNIDSNQNIHYAISDLDKFVALLGRGIKPVILEGSYRCPKKVVAVARILSELRDEFLGGKYDKNTYLIESEINIVGQFNWIQSTKSLSQEGDMSFDANTVIICQEHMFDEAGAKFPGAVVLSHKEAKGLQFKNVILFEPFTPELLRALKHVVLNYTGEVKQRGRRSRRGIGGDNDKFAPVLNEIYTAITRAELALTIFQSRNDEVTTKLKDNFTKASNHCNQDEIILPHEESPQSTSDACSSSEAVERARRERFQGFLNLIKRLELQMQYEAANRIRRSIGIAEVAYTSMANDAAPRNDSRRKNTEEISKKNKVQIAMSDNEISSYLKGMQVIINMLPESFTAAFEVLLELPDFYKCCLGLSLERQIGTPLIEHIVASSIFEHDQKLIIFQKIVEKITHIKSAPDLFKILRYLGIKRNRTLDFVNYLFKNKDFDAYLANLLPQFTPEDFSIFIYLITQEEITESVEAFLQKNVKNITVAQFTKQVEVYHDTKDYLVGVLSFFNCLLSNKRFSTLLSRALSENNKLLTATKKLLGNNKLPEKFTVRNVTDTVLCPLYILAEQNPMFLVNMLSQPAYTIPIEYLFVDRHGNIQDKNSIDTIIALMIQTRSNDMILLLTKWILANKRNIKRSQLQKIFSIELRINIEGVNLYMPFIDIFSTSATALESFQAIYKTYPYIVNYISFKGFDTPFSLDTTTGEKSVSYFLKLVAIKFGMQFTLFILEKEPRILDEIDINWLYEVCESEKHFIGKYTSGLDYLCTIEPKLLKKLYHHNRHKMDKERFANFITKWHDENYTGDLKNFSPLLGLCFSSTIRRELLWEIIHDNPKVSEVLTKAQLTREFRQDNRSFSCVSQLSTDESGREILKLLKSQNPDLDFPLTAISAADHGFDYREAEQDLNRHIVDDETQKTAILTEILKISQDPTQSPLLLDALIMSTTLSYHTLFIKVGGAEEPGSSEDIMSQMRNLSLLENLSRVPALKPTLESFKKYVFSRMIADNHTPVLEDTLRFIAAPGSGDSGLSFIFWLFECPETRQTLSNMLPRFSANFFYLLVILLDKKKEVVSRFIKDNAQKITPEQFYKTAENSSSFLNFFRFIAYREEFEDLLEYIFKHNNTLLACLAGKSELTYLTKLQEIPQLENASGHLFSEITNLICKKISVFEKMIGIRPDILLSITPEVLLGYPSEPLLNCGIHTPLTQLVLINHEIGIPIFRKWVDENFTKGYISLHDLERIFSYCNTEFGYGNIPLIYGFGYSYTALENLFFIIDKIPGFINVINIKSLSNPVNKDSHSYFAHVLTSNVGISLLLGLCRREPNFIRDIDENSLYEIYESRNPIELECDDTHFKSVISTLLSTDYGLELFRLLFPYINKARFFDFLTSLPVEQSRGEEFNHSLIFSLCSNPASRRFLLEMFMTYPEIVPKITPELLLKKYVNYNINLRDKVTYVEQNVISVLSNYSVGTEIFDILSSQTTLRSCIEDYLRQNKLCKATNFSLVHLAELNTEKNIRELWKIYTDIEKPDMEVVIDKLFVKGSDISVRRRFALNNIVVKMRDDNNKHINLLIMQTMISYPSGIKVYLSLYDAWPGIVTDRFVELLFSVDIGVSACHWLLKEKNGRELFVNMLTKQKSIFGKILTAEILCLRPPLDSKKNSKCGFFSKTTPKFGPSLYEMLIYIADSNLLRAIDEAKPGILAQAYDIVQRRSSSMEETTDSRPHF